MKIKYVLMITAFSIGTTYGQANAERGALRDSENHNPFGTENHAAFYRMQEVQANNTKADINLKNANDFVKLKKYDEAISEYTKAIEINTNFSAAYYNRGLVEVVLGQKEKGCLDLKQAAELGEKDANVMIQKYCK